VVVVVVVAEPLLLLLRIEPLVAVVAASFEPSWPVVAVEGDCSSPPFVAVSDTLHSVALPFAVQLRDRTERTFAVNVVGSLEPRFEELSGHQTSGFEVGVGLAVEDRLRWN